jgi:cytochrome c oxidase cbb3-type subunit 3
MIAQPDTALGAQVFADNCTACHGRGGRGDGRLVVEGSIRDVPDFTDPATMTVSDPEAIFQIITYGRLEVYMPPWGGVLSEEARWAVTMDIYGLMQGYRQAGTDARSAGR